ncbi:PEP-CTERM sorting domain-containing protein [Methylotuvimicrobium alcaliphilum]|nr:PEP-CTERM sorting domain-containing protein [Methylotuvimicrobium alcaliphilum]
MKLDFNFKKFGGVMFLLFNLSSYKTRRSFYHSYLSSTQVFRDLKYFALPFALVATLLSTDSNAAAIWQQPFDIKDSFNSIGIKELDIGGQRVIFEGTGPTQVIRDCVYLGEKSDCYQTPFEQNGLDTIMTEMVSLHLVGKTMGFHTEIRVGEGWSFFDDLIFTDLIGLDHSRGQIQDLAGLPDGNIDFPANSIFDIFFDVWIDFNNDGIVDVGEVVSNDVRDLSGDSILDSYALRMFAEIEDVPPPKWTQYICSGKVSALDPSIGTFDAVVEEACPPPLDLFFINPDRTEITSADLDLPSVFAIDAKHIVPEPTTFMLLSAGLALFGWQHRRKPLA